MDVTRRDFFTLIAVAGGLGVASPQAVAHQLEPERLLDFRALGNVTLLHMTDPHGTLLRGLKRVTLDPRPRVRVL